MRFGAVAGRPSRVVALFVLALMGLTACGGGGGGDGAQPTGQATAPAGDQTTEASPAEAEGESLRVGVLAPTTGPQTVIGDDLVTGLEFYVSDNPNAGNRPIELVIEDTASQPQQGLESARKLVEDEQVDMIIGIINSAVLAAVSDYILENDVPLIVTNAGTDEFTEAPVDPLAFRVTHSNAQYNNPLGWYAYEQLGYRNAAVITYDFLAGEQQAAAFKDAFTEAGGNIANEQRVALGTTDMGPFISNIPDGADVVYAFLAGSEAVQFHQQAANFGLDKPVIGPGFTLDPIVLGAVGESGLGFVGAIGYAYAIESEDNQQYVEDYQEFADRLPTSYATDAYVGLEAVVRAIEETGGDSSPEVFAEALASVEFDSVRGPFRFDENHQAVFTVYIYEVVEGEDGPTFQVVDQIEDVTHDWQPPS